MKRQRFPLMVSLAIVALFWLHSSGHWPIGLIQRLETLSYDMRLRLSLPKEIDPRIVIVDIDEKSLAEQGQWPWRRERMARLVNQLFDHYQIAVLGFDVVFAEPDKHILPALEQLAQGRLKHDAAFQAQMPALRQAYDDDQQFAAAMRDRPVVLGYYFTGQGEARQSGALPKPAVASNTHIRAWQADGYGANLAILQQAASAAGHMNPVLDVDGLIRRVPMLMAYQGEHYASLSLATIRALIGNPEIRPQIRDNRLQSLQLDGFNIPLDQRGAALIPFRGPAASFRSVSATDILEGRLSADALTGTIVLVGTTALGLRDQRATPISSNTDGVEVHASLISGILDQTLKKEPSDIASLEAAGLLVIGLLLAFTLPRLGPIAASLLSLALLVAVIGGNSYAWQTANLVLPLAAEILLIISLFVWNMSAGFVIEARHKRRITRAFGQYVPPTLVEKMSRESQHISMAAESREMTVLFSDIRDFTSLSEQLNPTDLAAFINAYLSRMTQIIQQHGGTIDKYIGDAIMAFWGAPLPDPDHAQHTVLAALDMQAALPALNAEFAQRGWPQIHIGIGVNSGLMQVGDMGSEFRKAYTVMGDAVNLAARLEGLTKVYGAAILVGENTQQACQGIHFREIDRVRVKGKQLPCTIHEALPSNASTTEIDAFHNALRHYHACDWKNAHTLFQQLLHQHPQTRLYSLYTQRAETFHNHPPAPDWDGVFTHQKK